MANVIDELLNPFIGGVDTSEQAKEFETYLKGLAESQKGLLPWQAGGVDAGFSADSGRLNYELSPELKGIYADKIDDYGTQQANLAKYSGDPDAAAEAYYDRYKGIVEEDQEQERLALENRLLAQGMLGSTGGGMRTKALYGAQMRSDMEARMGADTQVQSIIDMYRGRGDASLQGAFGIADRPFQYANAGIAQGQVASNQLAAANSLAAEGAHGRLLGEQAVGNSKAGLFGQLANAYALYKT